MYDGQKLNENHAVYPQHVSSFICITVYKMDILTDNIYLLFSGWIVPRSLTYHFKLYPKRCSTGVRILRLVIV